MADGLETIFNVNEKGILFSCSRPCAIAQIRTVFVEPSIARVLKAE